eukprot:TRINITY_DN1107_c0_g1_i1.p1 TRINITY_DN1107_c0_g1~~TRINITY_DN1107_c0_g1_i1.p1  ORF type:complete len:379 (-),score=28.83 TRINITY_DN1107_c0_g1_i1:100-1236(-)
MVVFFPVAQIKSIIDHGFTRHVWIHFVVLFLALVSLWFLGKYFYNVYYIYSLYQSKYGQGQEEDMESIEAIYALIAQKNAKFGEESQVRLRKFEGQRTLVANSFTGSISRYMHADEATKHTEEYQWLDRWKILIFVGNLIQVTGTVLYLFGFRDKTTIPDILMGLGCFFAWLNIVSYLEINVEYYMMFITLFKSLPTILKFMLSVLPIFIGCGMLLCCVFWISDYFVTPNKAFYSEFALFLGDIVMDSSERLPLINYAWGNVYIYCFIIFFMFVVQTILLAIVSKTFTQDVRTLFSPEQAKEEVAGKSKEEVLREIAVCEIETRNALEFLSERVEKSEKEEILHEYDEFMTKVLEEVDRMDLDFSDYQIRLLPSLFVK